jgi:hypothetical protein
MFISIFRKVYRPISTPERPEIFTIRLNYRHVQRYKEMSSILADQ